MALEASPPAKTDSMSNNPMNSAQVDELRSLKSESQSLQTRITDLQRQEDKWNGRNRKLAIAAVMVGGLLGIFSWLSQEKASTMGLAARPLSDLRDKADTRIREILDSQTAVETAAAGATAEKANATASQATQKAEEARLEQSKISRENLKLQAQVEQEKTARIALERKVAPRALSRTQQTDIRRLMFSLGGQRMDLFLYPNDGEIANIANEVAAALLPGWTFKVFFPMSGFVQGMAIEYDPHDQAADQRAKTLAGALREQGIEISDPVGSLPTPANQIPNYTSDGSGPPSATIRLTIGRK